MSLPASPLRLLPTAATFVGWDFHPLKFRAFSRRTMDEQDRQDKNLARLCDAPPSLRRQADGRELAPLSNYSPLRGSRRSRAGPLSARPEPVEGSKGPATADALGGMPTSSDGSVILNATPWDRGHPCPRRT